MVRCYVQKRDGDEAMVRCYVQKRDGDEAVVRCYVAMLRCDAQKRDGDQAMLRCYALFDHSIVPSLHHFIAIAFRFQRARNHGNLTRLCQRACSEFVVGFSNTCEQNETPNLEFGKGTNVAFVVCLHYSITTPPTIVCQILL